MNTITWSVLQMDSHLATECSHTRCSCGDVVSAAADTAGVCVCVCVSYRDHTCFPSQRSCVRSVVNT